MNLLKEIDNFNNDGKNIVMTRLYILNGYLGIYLQILLLFDF